jgi:hypothetical protein
MLRRVFIALVTGSIAAARLHAAAAEPRLPFKVTDAMPTFWKFWDSTLQEPTEQRVGAFFDTVVAAYPDLFHHGLIASGSLTDLGTVPEAQARVAKYLADLGPFIPTMRHITIALRDDFPRYVQEFSTTFADYAPTTPVYFSVSLFGHAGGLLLSGENTGLYFGIDGLAQTGGNLKIVIQHELFHQYHYQISPEITDNRAAWTFMWEEGLATYVSYRMNPGATADQALVTPNHLSELAKPHLPALARRLLDHADSTNPIDYIDLFSVEQSPAGIPARGGYYVGFRVAQRLSEKRSLMQLAHLRGPELRRDVLDTLAALEKRP